MITMSFFKWTKWRILKLERVTFKIVRYFNLVPEKRGIKIDMITNSLIVN